MFNLPPRRRTGGILSVEFIFLLPVLLLLFSAALQVGFIFFAYQQLHAANRDVVRLAAMHADDQSIRNVLTLHVGPARLSRMRVVIDYEQDSNPLGTVTVWLVAPADLFVPNVFGLRHLLLPTSRIFVRAVALQENGSTGPDSSENRG